MRGGPGDPPHHPGMDRRRFLLTSLARAPSCADDPRPQQAGGSLQRLPDFAVRPIPRPNSSSAARGAVTPRRSFQ
jgi:hypothetical protein